MTRVRRELRRRPRRPGSAVRVGLALALVLGVGLASAGVGRAECPVEPFEIEAPVVLGLNADGIGGSGLAPPGGGDEDGIGGSGLAPALDPEDGIGGSGLIGTVTAFGSVCVNGREIDYDGSVAFRLDGRAADLDSLAVGQVVTVGLGAGAQDGSSRATAISVEYAVVGPLMDLDRERGEARVLGERVLLGGLPEASLAALAISPDGRVAVSGLRRADGAIVGSRVDPAPRDSVDGVRIGPGERIVELGWRALDLEGYVEVIAGDGLELHGQRFAIPGSTGVAGSAGLRVGDRVRIRALAAPAGGAMQVVSLVRVPERALLRSLDRDARPAPAAGAAGGGSQSAVKGSAPGGPPGGAPAGGGGGGRPDGPPGLAARDGAPPGQAARDGMPPGQAVRAGVPPGQAVRESTPAAAQAAPAAPVAERPGRPSGAGAPGLDRPSRPSLPERPVARPERPVVRPDRPAVRPERPAMRPERPAPPRDFLPRENPGRGGGRGRP